jgi:YHS domain-containing protein
MRNFVILLLVIIAMAMLRRLVVDVIGAVRNALGSPGSAGDGQSARGAQAHSGAETHTGHMVRDPISGTYIDERIALKETVNGKTVYFESRENRDSYLRQARSG